MPYRRRYRRRRRRRRTYRRKRMSRRRRAPWKSISVRKMPVLFPDNARVTFKYVNYVALNLGASPFFGIQSFSLNDPQNPSLGATTAQPMGFQQWSQFYLNGICYKSMIKITFIPEQDQFADMLIGPDNDSSPPTAISQFYELPYYANRTCGGLSGGRAPLVMKHSMSVKVLEGRRIGSEDDYIFSMNTGAPLDPPIKSKFWHVAFFNAGIFTPFQARAKVEIFYYCRLIRRRTTLNPSSSFTALTAGAEPILAEGASEASQIAARGPL